MAKRDTDTEIWNEDWFIDLEGPYQLFWFYVKDCCDHSGFWRPNFKRFEQISGHRINQEKFLELVNSGKQRIIVLDTGKWFLVHYISFHYSILNLKNRFHNSVYETFRKNVTCENTMEYGFEVKLTSNCPQLEVNKEQRTENKEQRIKNKEKGGMGEKEIQDTPTTENKIPEKIRPAFLDFIEMRKKIRKPLTEKAKEMIFVKLENMYPGNYEQQIACLNRSTMNSWQGVFEEKKEQNVKKFGRQEVSNEFLEEQARDFLERHKNDA
jgi:hypothetical protein